METLENVTCELRNTMPAISTFFMYSPVAFHTQYKHGRERTNSGPDWRRMELTQKPGQHYHTQPLYTQREKTLVASSLYSLLQCRLTGN